MIIHLKKLAVGIQSISNLRERQKSIIEIYGELIHITRNKPKYYDNLILTGSIFWIIKRNVVVRQKILDIKDLTTQEGKRSTGIILENKLIKVRSTPMKPFQGWRYYKECDIPPDISDDEFSDEFNEELNKLGLY